jgi:hypothetical protein
MKTIALLVLLVPAHALASAPAVNVRDFGAVGNGTTDDSVAIQRALDAGAGGQVFFPMGTYLVTGIPNGFWCLKVSPGTELRGEDRAGTMLVEALNQAASVQLLWIENAPDVSITNLTLDGAKGSQTVNPQRHGMFTKNSPRLSLRHVIPSQALHELHREIDPLLGPRQDLARERRVLFEQAAGHLRLGEACATPRTSRARCSPRGGPPRTRREARGPVSDRACPAR